MTSSNVYEAYGGDQTSLSGQNYGSSYKTTVIHDVSNNGCFTKSRSQNAKQSDLFQTKSHQVAAIT